MEDNANNSRLPVWKSGLLGWYYFGVVVAMLFYLFMSCGPLIAEIFDSSQSAGKFYFRFMLIIGGVNGLKAVSLVVRRRLTGVMWSLVPFVLIYLATRVDIGWGELRNPEEAMAPFIFPAILLFSQAPFIRMLQKTGSGWAFRGIKKELKNASRE